MFEEEFSKLEKLFPELIRPPGAGSEDDFLSRCSKCLDCVRACPYFAIEPTHINNEFFSNTPSLRQGRAFCRFCKDFPCIEACKTGALSQKNLKKPLRIARAEIITDKCILTSGNECNQCYQVCQQTYQAIKEGKKTTDNSGISPEIIPDACTGCGECLTVCPTGNNLAIRLISTD